MMNKTHVAPLTSIRRALVPCLHRWLIFGAILGACHGCHAVEGLNKTAKDAVETIRHSVDKLAQQSTQWQSTMTQLEQDLIAQGQSTLATEVSQLVQRGVSTAGVELRCDADFVGHRMREGLERILARIEGRSIPPVTPFFCQVVPTQINLGLEPDRRIELAFYGYNLDTGRVQVAVLDDGGEQPVPDTLVAMPTHYLMTVNISESNGVRFSPTAHQMVFRLGSGGEVRNVNVVAAHACGGAGQACCAHSQCSGGLCVANGCHVFALADPMFEIDVGGGSGGGAFRDECPAGSVAVGFRGRAGAYIDQIQLSCSSLNGDGSLGGGNVAAGPHHGGGGGGDFDESCDTGQVLVGFAGRSGDYIDQLYGQCSTPAFVAGLGGGSSRTVHTLGGGGGSPFAAACPAGAVMIGIQGQAGTLVDHLGFICRRLAS
jgi:hypothetical protein